MKNISKCTPHINLLQESAEELPLLQEIIEELPLRIFWKDHDSRFLGCNTLFAQDAGCSSPDELIGKTDVEMSWKDQAELYRADDRLVMESSMPRLGYEEPQTAPDGKLVWLRTSKVPLRNAANQVIGVLGIYEDITEYKRLQLQLRQQDKKYSSVIQSSGEGFWLVDEEGRLKEANPSYARFSGYSMEELVSMRINDLEVLEFPKETMMRMEKIIKNGSDTFETVHRRKDGCLWDAEVNATFIPEDGGYFVAFIRDITERKRAERLLVKHETQLNEAQHIAQIGSWELDLVSGRLDWSAEIYRIFELDPDRFSVSYEGFLQIVHPEDRDMVDRAYSESVSQQTPYELIHRLLMPDGRIKHVQERGRTDYTADGIPRRSIGTLQDVTERIRVKQELLIAATAFETQEGIIITDADQTIIRVNQAFTRITGYSAEEAVGTILKSGRHDAAFYRGMHEAVNSQGYWQGEILDRHKDGRVYPKWLSITAVKDPAGGITHYVGNFSDITESKAAAEQIQNLAFYDPLTQLPNRRLLMDRLEHAIATCSRSRQYGAVLFLDLDNFKTLNDTKGHQVGDELLIDVANRLRACVREVDTIARLGGDEFIVLLENLDEKTEIASIQAKNAAVKITSVLSEPYSLRFTRHHTSTSIGIVLFAGHDETAGTILARADTAMYQAKKSGKDTYCFFDPAMQHALERRTALEAALRLAITNGQLNLFYQAQVDGQGRIIGAEALIRWLSPELGLISPLQFIPLAEETGLILHIGEWVLHTACAQLMAWKHTLYAKELSIAVNVSAKQFYQPDFVDHVQALIRRYNINPRQLKLELTESMVLEDIDVAVDKMLALKSGGIALSMDDFGTGYSSLSYLRQLPFDQLKIDKSFIPSVRTNPNDAFIVSTVIALGQRLGMDVIAEGVEDMAQHQLLKNLGCAAFQGYYFGRPVPIHELEDRIKNQIF